MLISRYKLKDKKPKNMTDTVLELEEVNIYKAVIESISEGVAICDVGGVMSYFNPAAGRILGYGLMQSSPDEWAKMYGVFLPDKTTPFPTDQFPLARALKGESVDAVNMYIHNEHKQEGLFIKVNADSIKNKEGKIIGAAAVFEDISKEIELQRTKDEFFSIASHELRTPLTAIRGNTALIHQYFWDQLTNTDLREMLDDIHESSVRLIDIVNDFLDSSRLEQKRMNFNIEPFDIVGTVYSALKEYQVTGSRRHIALEAQKPTQPVPLVLADQNRTKQVLINLVGNALKFTESGSVTVGFDMEGNKFVKVYVKDTGHGIPLEAQKKLFQKYEQSDRGTAYTRDAVRGTGLGLYISKLMIEAMNGTISLEHSEIGKGTIFAFKLPVFQAPSSGLVQKQNNKFI
jgi:signal transduction histidine kinase